MKLKEQNIHFSFLGKNDASYWALIIFSICVGSVGFIATRDYLMDDALITLRYSYNFPRLGIPVWNQADIIHPSMGYTSFLWMLINAFPALFTGNREWLVLAEQCFALLSFLAILLLLTDEVFRLPVSTTFKFFVVFIMFSQFGYGMHVNSGMETMLFSCLMLISVLAYAKGNYTLAYIFGILSFLTRPEGALLVATIIVFDIYYRRIKPAFVFGGIFLIVVLILLLLMKHWYGDIVPNPFYIKQGLMLNQAALKQTFFFLATLAFPYLLMSAYGVFALKNRISILMFITAWVFLLYYLSVSPLMNVLSRYQWPSLVLLTCASIPVWGSFGSDPKKYRTYIALITLLFVITNVGNGFGASYFASATGKATKNLIEIGKRMAIFRSADKWLVYHDAGAVSYFSDWNTYETMGLTNRAIAKGEVQVDDLYQYPDAEIILQNFDMYDRDASVKRNVFTEKLLTYGFVPVKDIPILSVPGQRNFIVSVYAKHPSFAADVFQSLTISAELEPTTTYKLYRLTKRIVKGR
jgi:hypothetical protein